jgi:hypothetical protein
MMASSENKTPLFGVLAEYASPRDIFHACEKVRDAGFEKWDAHTPFPVHGLNKAMGLRASKVPWVALVMGLIGVGGALLLQWWTSAVDYKLIIAGKPYFSWPAFVPICFEVMVLFAALGAVLGMFHFNRLPQLYHSLFHSKRFERASDDAFFISIEAVDPKFDSEKTAQFLKELGATHVELVDD